MTGILQAMATGTYNGHWKKIIGSSAVATGLAAVSPGLAILPAAYAAQNVYKGIKARRTKHKK